jgi:hypothetical protein
MRTSGLLLVGLALGCGGEAPDDSQAPELFGALELSAAAVEFEGLPIGEESEQLLQLANVGDGELRVHDIAFSDDSMRVHWSLLGLTTVTIPPGGLHDLQVRFAPQAVGSLDVHLRIGSDDPSAPSTQVSLRGDGLGVGDLYVEPQALDFGTVVIGDALELELLLANYGTADIEIGAVTTSGATSDYSVALDPSGTTMAPGDEHGLVVVRFEPSYDGLLYGTLSIATNDPDTPVLEVSLSGEGDAPS